MAKKSTNKKASRKAAEKSAKKGDSKKSAKKKSAKKASLAPKTVKTGKGLTPAELGADLVRMFNAGQWAEIEDKHWSPKITSIEGVGVSLAWEGRKAVRAKNNEWSADHVIHSGTAEGPFVGATGFAVKFHMDVETKSTGQRIAMSEVGVYTVKNGKIVQEEFMYGMG